MDQRIELLPAPTMWDFGNFKRDSGSDLELSFTPIRGIKTVGFDDLELIVYANSLSIANSGDTISIGVLPDPFTPLNPAAVWSIPSTAVTVVEFTNADNGNVIYRPGSLTGTLPPMLGIVVGAKRAMGAGASDALSILLSADLVLRKTSGG